MAAYLALGPCPQNDQGAHKWHIKHKPRRIYGHYIYLYGWLDALWCPYGCSYYLLNAAGAAYGK